MARVVSGHDGVGNGLFSFQMKSVSWAKEDSSENIPEDGKEAASLKDLQVGHTPCPVWHA
jgi:hypothetical protein